MRMSILIGLILVLLGGVTLYQTRNGFFMYVAGHLTHWPPSDTAAFVREFDALAAEESETLGLDLGEITDARIACLKEMAPQPPTQSVETALRRLNLVLLGVGVNSQSSVIEPDARRITELRRDLTRDARDWREPDMNEIEAAKLEEVLEALSDRDNPIYVDIGGDDAFWHLDFKKFTKIMLENGEVFHACVMQRK